MPEHSRPICGGILACVATHGSRHPAVVAYAVAWGTAVAWLIFRGHVVLGAGATAALLVVLCWSALTVRITKSAGTDADTTETDRRADSFGPRGRRALQLVIVLVFVALTAYQGLVFHDLIPESWRGIPGWSALVDRMAELAREPLGMPATYLVNPVTYFVLPFLALLLAGVRPRGLGFRRAHRPWRVLLLWSVFNLGAVVFALASGTSTASGVGRTIVGNAVQNGFFEEFLFRGALLTRIGTYLGDEWGLVLSSLAFGLWHTGAASAVVGGSGVPDAIAAAVALQSLGGLALGVVYLRTRSLLAPSILHVVFNTA